MENETVRYLAAVGLSVLSNAIVFVASAARSVGPRRALKFSWPYIAVCFSGALMAAGYALAINHGG